jgi:hypothetical protein
MDKLLLKTALSDIWALVYLAKTRDLDLEQLDKLREAVNAVKRGWPQNDPFRGRASMLCGDVRSSGILSLPPRKQKGTEGIMGECQSLQRYLDSN